MNGRPVFLRNLILTKFIIVWHAMQNDGFYMNFNRKLRIADFDPYWKIKISNSFYLILVESITKSHAK